MNMTLHEIARSQVLCRPAFTQLAEYIRELPR